MRCLSIFRAQKLGFRLLLLLTLGLPGRLWAQRPPLRWGVVSETERELVRYQPDTLVAVVILYDYGVWTPQNFDEGKVALRHHRRYKVLRPEGVGIADQVLDLAPGESIKGLLAQTINYEGGKRRVHKLKLKFLPPQTRPDGGLRYVFRFPEVSVGSVVEYTYLLQTQAWEQLKPWFFQQTYPVLWSEVRLRGFEPYHYAVVGRPLDHPPLGFQRWVAKEVPPWPVEPLTAGPADGRKQLRFQFFYPDESAQVLPGLAAMASAEAMQRQWEMLGQNLEQDSRLYEDADKLAAFQTLVDRLIYGAATETEIVARLHAHVRDYLIWDSTYAATIARSPSEIYYARRAHSGEINMLLMQLLYQAGLSAHKVFVPTVGQGPPITEVAIRSQFDHIVVQVMADGHYLLVDATEPLLPATLLPPASLNQLGWVMRPDTMGWIRMPYPTYDLTRASLQLQWLHPDSLLRGELNLSFEGYAAWRARRASDDPPLETRLEMGNLRWQGGDSLSQPLAVSATLTGPSPSSEGGGYILYPGQWVAPPLPELPSGRRYRPLYWESLRSWETNVSFFIPEGFRVVRLPESKRITLPGQDASFELRCEAGAGLVLWQAEGRIGRRRFPADHYATLLVWVQTVAELLAQPLVLVPE
ncbi:MAG: DUF3857 domain-containing protein [Bacteroidetes bacterium]|nr:MAG: DUF3857 domain-containing protein [Bacteroidota bacterium]